MEVNKLLSSKCLSVHFTIKSIRTFSIIFILKEELIKAEIFCIRLIKKEVDFGFDAGNIAEKNNS